jgi:hypothetical protein
VTVVTVTPVEQKLRLFDEAERFLDLVIDAAAELGVDLPNKQYITTGEAVHDCEQVAVTLAAVSIGLPNMPPTGINEVGNCCPPAWSMHLVVDIVRCVPTPIGSSGVVSADRLTESAEVFSQDTAILLDATAARQQNYLFGNLVAAVQYPPPSGGFGTSRLLLQLGVH